MEYVSLRYDGIMRGALSFAGSYYLLLSPAFWPAFTRLPRLVGPPGVQGVL